MQDRILTEKEFAKFLRVSQMTVRRQRKAGKLEYVELTPTRFGYKESYAERLIAQRTVPATAA
jgi:predicted site-specific integrase-resolvase